MRLPHHLVRHPSGVYYFRQRVPRDLQAVLGLRVVKRSLRTTDLPTAGGCARLLGLRYAQAFAVLRSVQVSKVPSVEEILASLTPDHASRPFEATFDPVTRALTHIRTNGSEQDNAAAMSFAQTVFRQAPPQHTGPLPTTAEVLGTAMTVGEALALYRTHELQSTPETTRRHWERALATFERHVGAGRKVGVVTRPLAAAWADSLMAGGNTKRTAARAVSQVAQVFEWLISRGELSGVNPVKGVLVMKLREKLARKDEGFTWEPFERADLVRIFDAENYKRLKLDHAYWGPLLGLFTGARVGEIAQLYLRDFVVEGGHPSIRIQAGSDGQTVKTQSSKRLVPLHPDLLSLGLMSHVDDLRDQGHERLFPDMRIDSKAGAGNSISKAFSYYLSTLGIKARRKNGTVGFHSLRKNVIQQLQGTSLPAERRRALVGHEAGDGMPHPASVHELFYMRPWTADELAAFFPALPWGQWLNIERLRRDAWTS